MMAHFCQIGSQHHAASMPGYSEADAILRLSSRPYYGDHHTLKFSSKLCLQNYSKTARNAIFYHNL